MALISTLLSIIARIVAVLLVDSGLLCLASTVIADIINDIFSSSLQHLSSTYRA